MITKGLGIASKGMLALIDQLDTTANNLANVNTTGFKKSNLVFKNVYNAAVYERNNPNSYKFEDQKYVGTLAMGPKTQQILLDFSQGTLERTYNPLDLALEGDGMFKLQSLDGEISYTRNGSFVLNNKKQLVTKEGDLVLDVKNKPIILDVKKMNIDDVNDLVIGEDGQITTNNDIPRYYQRIQICDFVDKTDLRSIGHSKFQPKHPETNKEMQAEKFSVQQGALEAANANTVNEMINIIKVSRNYETLSKVVQNNNTMLNRAINLGRINSV